MLYYAKCFLKEHFVCLFHVSVPEKLMWKPFPGSVTFTWCLSLYFVSSVSKLPVSLTGHWCMYENTIFWAKSFTPKDILEELCVQYHYIWKVTVTWTGRNVFIAERVFVKLSCDPVLGLWKVCEKGDCVKCIFVKNWSMTEAREGNTSPVVCLILSLSFTGQYHNLHTGHTPGACYTCTIQQWAIQQPSQWQPRSTGPTERVTDRQTLTQTQTHTDTHRQTDRQTDTEGLHDIGKNWHSDSANMYTMLPWIPLCINIVSYP